MRKSAIRHSVWFMLVCCLPTLALAQPTMPVGIPAPPWPADLDADHPAFPSPWNGETTGFYYINPAGGCSDTRVYGFPGTARCTPPSGPAAGAVVTLDGAFGTTERTLTWTNGTEASPIHLTAYDNASKPTIAAGWTLRTRYTIVSGLAWNYNLRGGISLADNNMLVRWCTYTNVFDSAPSSSFNTGSDNIVFYRNTLNQNGVWNTADNVDVDRHGVLLTAGADNVWLLYNTIQHHRGDGVQIGGSSVDPATINKIYIGKNTISECNQYGVWVKSATDVIVSENEISGMTQNTTSGRGGGLGGQYYPIYVWWLLNTVHDSNNGVRIESLNGAYGPFFAIGNVFYNIKSSTTPCTATGGFVTAGAGTHTIINNTFDNNAADLIITGDRPTTFQNNILHRWTGECTYAVNTGSTNATMNYNLYDNNAQTVIYNGSTYTSLATFAAARNQEANRVVADPLFTAEATHDYTLQAASPAIDNGVVAAAYQTFYDRYGIDIRKDIAGTVRPQINVWDIGAYERSTGAVADNTAPTVPTNVVATGTGAATVTVTWTASTDAVGVTGYHVERDGNVVGTVGAVTTFTDSGLSPSTTYTYKVSAFDAVGNTSAMSDADTATTSSWPKVGAPSRGRGSMR